jgi:hypothetical protein
MPQLTQASPRITVRLFKTISRATVDGKAAASVRYQTKDDYIDLTPFLGEGSSVRTSKSVREPAGAFSIALVDKPHQSIVSLGAWLGNSELESISGLVEPMDLVEIRMWGGVGPAPHTRELPIIMRGFVSSIKRSETMSDDGKPKRTVTITGQDFGKIWQTFKVVYLAAYAERKALLTNFNLWDLFGIEAVNAMPSAQFVKVMLEKVINPHLDGMLPQHLPLIMPRQIGTTASVSVKHGVVHPSYQQSQGSIWDILKFHGDVGVWNELYTEDREDGVHCVYRAIPALHLSAPKGKGRKIQDDAPDPVYVDVTGSLIPSMNSVRDDSNVANFFWCGNQRFDLIDEMQRKLASIPAGDSRVSTSAYPNTAVKYYGVRMMQADTNQGDDALVNMTSGQTKVSADARSVLQEAWIDKRRRLMIEMNRDNVVLERGSLRTKGGLMRADGIEAMKAGDYASITRGRLNWEAYIVQIEHEFVPYQGYTQTLTFERGTGFATRIGEGQGSGSPWLEEQATRRSAK